MDEIGASEARRRWAPAFLRRHAGLLTSSALALVWLVLARENPTNTYHFAPIVVAASWGLARRWAEGEPGTPRQGLASAGGGIVIAAITGAELAYVNALEGPTLWGSGTASAEVWLFVVLGGALGYWLVTKRRAGLLLPG